MAVEYRTLGSTGLEVSAIGMGCWAIGGDAWGPVDDADSVATIRRALELGVTLFDTADVYGRGRSEDVLREALGGRRDEVVLATKVGLWHSGADRPNAYTDPAMVVESCEASLRRLGTDRIDVYQCHLWWDENTEVFLDAFDRLKAQGKIRAYGVSTNEIDHLRNFDRRGTCDTLQVDYSIMNREPEGRVLPYCLDRSIGVIVKGPLKMGVLTGKFDGASTFAEGDVRRGWPDERWFREALERVEDLRPLERGKPLSEAALAFVLHHPAVAAAIPGAKYPEQIESNASAADRSLDESALVLIDEVAPPPDMPRDT
jgi:aryl-alcohol dehydrogenase-like predicted oxidoreductase